MAARHIYWLATRTENKVALARRHRETRRYHFIRRAAVGGLETTRQLPEVRVAEGFACMWSGEVRRGIDEV